MSRARKQNGCIQSVGTKYPVWKCHYHVYEIGADGKEKRLHRSFCLTQERHTLEQAKRVLANRIRKATCDEIDRWALDAAMEEFRNRVDNGDLVYFISCPDTKVVKIGHTSNIARRLADLQHGNAFRLRVALACSGGEVLENKLQYIFDNERRKGEWFALTPTLREFIREANKEV